MPSSSLTNGPQWSISDAFVDVRGVGTDVPVERQLYANMTSKLDAGTELKYGHARNHSNLPLILGLIGWLHECSCWSRYGHIAASYNSNDRVATEQILAHASDADPDAFIGTCSAEQICHSDTSISP